MSVERIRRHHHLELRRPSAPPLAAVAPIDTTAARMFTAFVAGARPRTTIALPRPWTRDGQLAPPTPGRTSQLAHLVLGFGRAALASAAAEPHVCTRCRNRRAAGTCASPRQRPRTGRGSRRGARFDDVVHPSRSRLWPSPGRGSRAACCRAAPRLRLPGLPRVQRVGAAVQAGRARRLRHRDAAAAVLAVEL